VRHQRGRPPLLVARATDPGQMFKLVGFYPHAVGGEMHLEVNLDGHGAAERTGLLTATKFHVLGNAVSVQNLPKSAARRKVVRERFEFDIMRAPFSVGNGRFELHNATIKGPLVSANMRGRLDFRTRKLSVSGTFTPLSVLNTMFSDVPVVGEIVTGSRRDGVFAMTYALQGGLENPQLVVNPFSMITPGITRDLLDITPDDSGVAAPDKQNLGRARKGTRSSGSPVVRPGAKVGEEGEPPDAARAKQ
jgi:hypothetical protein